MIGFHLLQNNCQNNKRARSICQYLLLSTQPIVYCLYTPVLLEKMKLQQLHKHKKTARCRKKQATITKQPRLDYILISPIHYTLETASILAHAYLRDIAATQKNQTYVHLCVCMCIMYNIVGDCVCFTTLFRGVDNFRVGGANSQLINYSYTCACFQCMKVQLWPWWLILGDCVYDTVYVFVYFWKLLILLIC